MSLQRMLRDELPLNRKERFFTGTVLPMIVCKDNFRYFDLFLSLIDGLQTLDVIPIPDESNILFFTEYSLVESVSITSSNRFIDIPKAKDTPDIVILIHSDIKVLLAFEAKMYDAPTVDQLNRQMRNQQAVLGCIRNSLGVDRVCHYALIPEKLRRQIGKLEFPTITWESIYEKYEPVCANDYFFAMLGVALDSYDDLVSPGRQYGRNCEEKIRGQEIYDRFKRGALDKLSMGRGGGIHGDKLRKDIAIGNWRTYRYETSSKNPPNRNWFLIEDFVRLIDDN